MSLLKDLADTQAPHEVRALTKEGRRAASLVTRKRDQGEERMVVAEADTTVASLMDSPSWQTVTVAGQILTALHSEQVDMLTLAPVEVAVVVPFP